MSTYWLYLFLILFLCIIRVSPFMVNTFLTFCPDFLALIQISNIWHRVHIYLINVIFGTVSRFVLVLWPFFGYFSICCLRLISFLLHQKMACDLSQHGVPAPSHLEGGVPESSHLEGGVPAPSHFEGVWTRTLTSWGGCTRALTFWGGF